MWAWLDNFSPLLEVLILKQNVISFHIFFWLDTLKVTVKAPGYRTFEAEHPERYQNRFFTSKRYGEDSHPFYTGVPPSPSPWNSTSWWNAHILFSFLQPSLRHDSRLLRLEQYCVATEKYLCWLSDLECSVTPGFTFSDRLLRFAKNRTIYVLEVWRLRGFCPMQNNQHNRPIYMLGYLSWTWSVPQGWQFFSSFALGKLFATRNRKCLRPKIFEHFLLEMRRI